MRWQNLIIAAGWRQSATSSPARQRIAKKISGYWLTVSAITRMPAMSKRGKTVALLLIMIGGFLLRLAGLSWGQAYHRASSGDEMDAYRVALEFASGQERAQYIGQPTFNSGHVPGPLWALFWLAGLKIGGSPASVCLLVIFLGTARVYLGYRL